MLLAGKIVRMLLLPLKQWPSNHFSTDTASFDGCAVSSVVEHYLDTVGVTGSNPVSRTILLFICKTTVILSGMPEITVRSRKQPENKGF